MYNNHNLKKLFFYSGIILLIQNFNTLHGQSEKSQFEIKSAAVKDAAYIIEIILPSDFDTTGKRYPMLYFLDWNIGTQIVPALYWSLRFANEIEPIIIVGISQKGSMKEWAIDRTRDFTPTHLNREDLAELPPEAADLSGGAANFLSFFKDELIPLVESKYPSDTLNRGLAGYSFSGLFATYVLLNEPQLFQKYLIGSPSLWYDDFILCKQLKEMPAEKLAGVKKVSVSVGEKENWEQLKGFIQLRDYLQAKKLPSLEIMSEIVNDEGHRGAIPESILKGLKYMYGNK